MSQPNITVKQLADIVGATIKGDETTVITAIAPIQAAKKGQLSFLHSVKYLHYLEKTEAGALLVSQDISAKTPAVLLIVKDPYYAYSQIASLFASDDRLPAGIHSSAVIGEGAEIDPTAAIGPNVVVGKGVKIGARVQIHPGTVIGDRCVVGDDAILWSNVTLYFDVKVGARVILHSGCVIGADGFGYAPHQGKWHKIAQLGGVILEDDVEIGANTTIDRGALGDTIIKARVKLDNQIQIGHNAVIGEDTIMAGCSGVAGSTTVGRNCIFGVNSGVGGHLTIADQVILGGRAMITKSIKEPGAYGSGTGFDKHDKWKKNMVRFHRLDEFARRLMKLEKKVEKL